MGQGLTIGLHMQAGIPVLDVTGEWVSGVTDRVMETIDKLARAGHLEMVLNLQRTALVSMTVLRSLWPVVRRLRERHGRLEVVASIDQMEALRKAAEEGLLGVSTSMARALSRIKGQPVRSLEPSCTSAFAPDVA